MSKRRNKKIPPVLFQLTGMLNQYHSINYMEGSSEDKKYTKSILKGKIQNKIKQVKSNSLQIELTMSIEIKAVWERTRELIN